MSLRSLLPLVLGFTWCVPTLAQQVRPAHPRLTITHRSPAANSTSVARTSRIRIVFDQPIRAESLDEKSFHVFGRWSGVASGTTELLAGGNVLRFTPARPFSAGETVHVFLGRSLTGVSGAHLPHGFTWSFWADSRASSGTYTNTGTLSPGDTPYGAHGGDIDDDGDLDLCIPNEDTSDVSVYLNQGGGVFGAETTYGVGFHCSASEAADFDLDGDVDLVTANILDDDISVLIGNGDGTFQSEVRYNCGVQPRGVTVLDVDGDGDADIVTANRLSSDLSLFLNAGDGNFASEARFNAGLNRETGVVAADMDGDGIGDLVVIGYLSHDVVVLRGDGLGGFQALTPRAIGANPWMVVVGDVDRDGHNDVAAALSGANTAGIVRGNGAGGLFPATSYATGSFPIAIDLGDLNGDGWLDLTASCFGADFDLWRNLGNGLMGNHTVLSSITAGSCTVLHDRDGDGDIDITAIDELADRVLLFRQDG